MSMLARPTRQGARRSAPACRYRHGAGSHRRSHAGRHADQHRGIGTETPSRNHGVTRAAAGWVASRRVESVMAGCSASRWPGAGGWSGALP